MVIWLAWQSILQIQSRVLFVSISAFKVNSIYIYIRPPRPLGASRFLIDEEDEEEDEEEGSFYSLNLKNVFY